MKKYLRFTFLAPVAYSLVSAVLTGLFFAAAAAAYLPAGGTGVLSAFLFRYGYPFITLFGAAAAARGLAEQREARVGGADGSGQAEAEPDLFSGLL